jgi:hypothetical protein
MAGTVSSVLLAALLLGLLGTTGLVVGSTLRAGNVAELMLIAYVAAFTELVGLFLLLSLSGDVRRGTLIAGALVVFLAAAGVWLLAGRPKPARPGSFRLRLLTRHPPFLVLAIAVGGALSYLLALVLGTPPNGWDPLNYHLARAAFWLQSGRIGYIQAAYDQRLNFNPPIGEIGSAFALGVTRDETFAGFVQLLAMLACAVGVFAFARRIGQRRAQAAFGSLLFLTLPIVLLQSTVAKNDILVASFLLVAAVFIISHRLRDVVLASLAIALAVGTKFTAIYGLFVLLALALVAPPHRRRGWRVLGLALGTIVGSFWYVVNAVETGHILGDQSGVQGLTALFHPRANLLTAFGAAVDMLDVSGAQGKDILLYLGPAALVGVGLTLGAGDGRRRLRGLLTAGVIGSPLLLLLLSNEVGRPALTRLYEHLGRPQGYLAIGDTVASSATTASDTASWFGPVGLWFVVVSTVAGVVLVRRRSIPTLALVAVLAPTLWFVLVSVSLTYNPWLGRFFVFPVALSAAVWGMALTRSEAAWAATALGVTTMAFALIHYVEKPSGLRLLDRSPAVSVWSMTRAQVQSRHDPEIEPVLRFFDDEVPSKATVGLALSANDFGYPVFGPRLERKVDLVPSGSSARDVRAGWLLASTERAREIDTTCWRDVFQSVAGTVFKRAQSCAA